MNLAGIMENIHKQLCELNEKIDHLSDMGGEIPSLIDGKAALTAPEAAEILGMERNLLNKQAKRGEWPYFKKGSHYMYPVRPLLERMEEKGKNNMEQNKIKNQNISGLSLSS